MTSGHGGQLLDPSLPADAATYFIDPANSNVSFSARNRTATSTRAAFRQFAGTLFLDSERPERTTLAVYVTSSSIDTGWKDRDAHMRSAALLAAEQYPIMSFWSSSAEALGTNLCRLAGSLWVKGMTRPLVVDGEYRGSALSPQGGERVGFVGRSVLKRSEWGSLWGPVMDAGEWFMGDEVELLFEVSAVKRVPIRWWP
ncbi:YceI family protein [Streptomyces chiangmaiensis]|uniref:YceI family protein n=1 Tax=Streptomyces chiangmaiensis TaxID=766497 RepID=A0ABU7FWS6_9ACTN|nr:YceI family protein [Streptomyces chiangmaiensis]MED7828537.1 YceI family protein [Streptomyces chiangmaiensis]